MWWRVPLYVYLWATFTLLWLAWAVVQTVLRGRGYHPPIHGIDPSEEPVTRQSCVSWGLRRFINEGGTVHVYSSPRLPVWRVEWTHPKTHERWHFEPLFPQRGVRAVWHTFWHYGKPKRMKDHHEHHHARHG